jgi:hypothetical protein
MTPHQWKDPTLKELAETLPVPSGTPGGWETWCVRAKTIFKNNYPQHFDDLNELSSLGTPPPGFAIATAGGRGHKPISYDSGPRVAAEFYQRRIGEARAQALALLEVVDHLNTAKSNTQSTKSDRELALERCLHLLDRFELVARQLLRRHNNRTPLALSDEYDVQDLLHALLHIEFQDIRAEDVVPSQGGSSSRVDFHLYKEKIIVEVKKTRDKLGNKELTTQVNDDVGRYQHKPDCDTLVCFIYDPEHRITNPPGFEHDHSRVQGKFRLITVVRPK